MAEDKIVEVMEQLEQGIINTMDSEKYKAFLKMQSSFHSYSFNNAMLIFLQRPDATMVAGYQTWIKKFERNVMRGEKGITILAPCPYKYEKDIKVKNENTGAEEIKRVNVEGLRFRTATVFDVKQTQGKPLPELCQEITSSSDNANDLIKALKNISKVPVVEKDIDNGALGYYSRLEGLIAIKSGMSPDQTVKTLIHEYSHSELHSSKESALLDRATKEVQAESVAFVVANRFGIDTSQYSFEYLAAWSSGKELKELKQSFDLIQKTANKIINELENTLGIDVPNYIKSIEAGKQNAVVANNILDKIINIYKSEFPAIKHISERSAGLIDNLNESNGSELSIKDIKNLYKSMGKQVDIGNDKSDLQEFKVLKDIVDDIKQAQLKGKQDIAKQSKVISVTMEASL